METERPIIYVMLHWAGQRLTGRGEVRMLNGQRTHRRPLKPKHRHAPILGGGRWRFVGAGWRRIGFVRSRPAYVRVESVRAGADSAETARPDAMGSCHFDTAAGVCGTCLRPIPHPVR